MTTTTVSKFGASGVRIRHAGELPDRPTDWTDHELLHYIRFGGMAGVPSKRTEAKRRGLL